MISQDPMLPRYARATFGYTLPRWWTLRTNSASSCESRRERLKPEGAGIVNGHRRRVPGLRREELAMLAGLT